MGWREFRVDMIGRDTVRVHDGVRVRDCAVQLGGVQSGGVQSSGG